MSDVFVSYARSDEAEAVKIAEALRTRGYQVWRDDEIPGHGAFSRVIEENLTSAKAVLVVWSAEAAQSDWVRAESDKARVAGTLIQVSIDGTLPPLPFNQIQCTNLAGWNGDLDSDAWRKVEKSVASLAAGSGPATGEPDGKARRPSICVLPFINMSGDPEQEYFSDGITEDIITDLSKVSALSVVARNTSFNYKGKPVDVQEIGRILKVTHVLEGSVRKAAGRVRINAQLIDAKAGDHVWADRYDRELTDIFEIQDEFSNAIVSALQLKLLPKEKRAIEHRGTASPEAYNLYLMARQHWITGALGDIRRDETIVRICKEAIALDPSYARAWALMALAQSELRFWHEKPEDALSSAERALALDPSLPEPYCVKARYLGEEEDRYEEANKLIATALRLDPDSWEVNQETARIMFRQGRTKDAIPYFEKAASLMDTDYHNALMLACCYRGVGDETGHRRASQMTAERAQEVIAQDPTNGGALAAGAMGLSALGEHGRAKDWMQRALVIAPDNLTTRYNLGCTLSAYMNDVDAALDVLEPFYATVPSLAQIKHGDVDPDLDPLRSDPRFQKMVADAKNRLAAASEPVAAK